jgi:ubiquinone/menaquinone biosynthesis C-methylase UbiE
MRVGSLSRPMVRERARTEYLDRPDLPRAELAESLADIARLSRLGATGALLRAVEPFVERWRRDRLARPFRVLDLGTGGADIPVALARWAADHGHRVSVLALDLQSEVLACATAAARRWPEVRLVQADAVRPPVRSGTVDVALCSLTLHHLAEDAVVALLRVMATVARLGFVVSDLRRSRPAYAMTWLATRLLSRNRFTRHDGPLSVRRAYTLAELARLSAAAGLPSLRWRRAAFVRALGVYGNGAG